MKKIIVICCVCFLVILKTTAQNFNFGIEAGCDLVGAFVFPNNMAIKQAYNGLSYNLNGYLGYDFNSKLGVSIAPGFIQKGYENTRFNYFQLPLLLNYNLIDKFSICSGPELAYMLTDKSFVDNKFEVSGIVGINYSLSRKIDVGIRYSRAMTYFLSGYLLDSEGNLQFNQIDYIYNNYLQLNVRYRL